MSRPGDRTKDPDESRRGLAALFKLGRGAESGEESDSKLRRLLDINRALAAERDPRRLYAKILDAAIELTGAERAFLVITPAAAEPDVVASRNLDREEVRSA